MKQHLPPTHLGPLSTSERVRNGNSSSCSSARQAKQLLWLILLLLAGTSFCSAADIDRHQESFLVYATIGPAFPSGDYKDTYKTGFHGGGGIGAVVARGNALSLELVLRVDYHTFPRRKPRRIGNFLVESDERTSMTLEGRFRIHTDELLQPYVTIGRGYYGLQWPSTMTLAGVGVDIAVSSEGLRLFYLELRYMSFEMNLVRLDVGIRLG